MWIGSGLVLAGCCETAFNYVFHILCNLSSFLANEKHMVGYLC